MLFSIHLPSDDNYLNSILKNSHHLLRPLINDRTQPKQPTATRQTKAIDS